VIEAIVTGRDVGPHGATFEDGYRASIICDATLDSAKDGGSRVVVEY